MEQVLLIFLEKEAKMSSTLDIISPVPKYRVVSKQ